LVLLLVWSPRLSVAPLTLIVLPAALLQTPVS
jgi:hypothetical protein